MEAQFGGECVHELGCNDASTALMTSNCAIFYNICLYPVIFYIFYLIRHFLQCA